MCGFAGIYGVFSQQETETLEKGLQFRGNEKTQRYENPKKNIFLAHKLLRIRDSSEKATQPFWNKEKSIAILLDGEIYNSPELKKEKLSELGFQTLTDTEVVLRLYEKYGSEFLGLLDGMFSIGIWDAKNGRVTLARDGSGMKPLYWTKLGEKILFSSDFFSLSSLKSNRAWNYDAVFSYLTKFWVSSPNTCFEDINKLTPGSFLEVGKNLKIVQRSFQQNLKINRQAGLEEALGNSVSRCINLVDEKFKKGILFSGGLDSSLIVSLAKHSHNYLELFHGSSDVKNQQRDTVLARQISKSLDFKLAEVSSSRINREKLESICRIASEPVFDPATILLEDILQLAQKSEVRVLLTGVGADELFLGYRRHLLLGTLENFKFLKWVLKPKRVKSFLSSFVGDRFRHLDLTDQRSFFNGLYQWGAPELLQNTFQTEFFEKVSLGSLVDAEYFSQQGSVLDLSLKIDQGFYLPEHNLRYLDNLCLAHGIEARHPFLNFEVKNVARDIYKSSEFKKLHSKKVLRSILKKREGRSFVPKKKIGFFTSEIFWKDFLMSEIQKTTNTGHPSEAFIDWDRLRDFLRKKHFSLQQRDLFFLFSVISFRNWIDLLNSPTNR